MREREKERKKEGERKRRKKGGNGREGKRRKKGEKGREGKGREGKGRKGGNQNVEFCKQNEVKCDYDCWDRGAERRKNKTKKRLMDCSLYTKYIDRCTKLHEQ